jgi:hypothetical protein
MPLTLEELKVIQEEFSKADVNKDNVLSLQEFQTLLGASNLVFFFIVLAFFFSLLLSSFPISPSSYKKNL